MYWVGQKDCPGASVRCYGKIRMNFWVNLIRLIVEETEGESTRAVPFRG